MLIPRVSYPTPVDCVSFSKLNAFLNLCMYIPNCYEKQPKGNIFYGPSFERSHFLPILFTDEFRITVLCASNLLREISARKSVALPHLPIEILNKI